MFQAKQVFAIYCTAHLTIHNLTSGAPDSTERPHRHLAPGASASSSAHN